MYNEKVISIKLSIEKAPYSTEKSTINIYTNTNWILVLNIKAVFIEKFNLRNITVSQVSSFDCSTTYTSLPLQKNQ